MCEKDEDKKEPERIFKFGPIELYGTKRKKPSEEKDAFRDLKEALINELKPIIEPIVKKLNQLLSKFKK